MKITDFILNIQERYKMPGETEELQKVTDILKKDFGYYSESKLEKVWYAVKRYHSSNFAPNYSAIAHCMDKAGIGEQKTDNDNSFYQLCKTCGAKYVMGVSCCPKCNKYLPIVSGSPEVIMNEVEVIKCQSIPNDVVFCRQACPICPIFRSSTVYPRGIKCDSFHGEMRGEIKDCSNCKCRECCIDLGSKNPDMPTGALMGVIHDCIKSVSNKPEES